jgi:hypothetical protein
MAALQEDTLKGNTEPMCYMYFLRHKEKTYCVDATNSGRIGRLINHCRSRPNLVTKLFVVDDIPKLGLMAKQVPVFTARSVFLLYLFDMNMFFFWIFTGP